MADQATTDPNEPAQTAPSPAEFLNTAIAELKDAEIDNMSDEELREFAGGFHDKIFAGTNGDQAAIDQRAESIIAGIDQMKEQGVLSEEQHSQMKAVFEKANEREAFADAVISNRGTLQQLGALNIQPDADLAQAAENVNLQALLSNLGEMNNIMGVLALLVAMVIATVTQDPGVIPNLANANAPDNNQENNEDNNQDNTPEVTSEDLKAAAGEGAVILEGDFPDGGVFENDGQAVDLEDLHGKDFAIAKDADGTYTLAVADPEAEGGAAVYRGIKKEDLGLHMQMPVMEAFPEQLPSGPTITTAPETAPSVTGN